MSSHRLILAHALDHDNVRYEYGTAWSEVPIATKWVWDLQAKAAKEVPTTTAEQEAKTAELLANHTLVYEDEARPEVVISSQDQEIERLNAELEELKQKMGVPATLGSGGVHPSTAAGGKNR